MPDILWTGEMAFLKKMILNVNGILAWISGNMKDTDAMKQDMTSAYNGERTADVVNYDTYGWDHYNGVAVALLEEISLSEKHVLDVGCGTGISTIEIVEGKANKVCGTDISEYMLGELKKKVEAKGYQNVVDVILADAENLPFDDNVFDVAVSNMVLGLVPNQEKMIREMIRVVKPGGVIALSTHGPTHYAELSDAVFAAIPKRYMLGRRILYWPRGREWMQRFFQDAGLNDVKVKQSIWHDSFQSSNDMYEFIASSTGNFYASFIPDEVINSILNDIRQYFIVSKIDKITLDVVYAYGKKAES
ncbi:MAG: class I SAM-dependent methyltransferase [Firmicutes bacterium]|nr:class I SAM-dependent methyltransferase [Bacillota bacterium]